jgi:hypothetical protein
MDNVYKGGEYEPFKRKSGPPNTNKMSIKNKIALYFNLADDIHKYFGYKEDWVTIPMESCLDSYWLLVGEEKVAYSDKPLTKEIVEEGKELYSAFVYKQRFLQKWVYRTEELTLICADTRTDGNKYLMIFDNAKECTDEELKKLYMEHWDNV